MVDKLKKTFFDILAVGLVHRECRYQSKMATQVEKAKCVIWFIETNSDTTVHRLYRNTYRKVTPTTKSIYAWRKKFEETGCLCKGKSPAGPRVADDLDTLMNWVMSQLLETSEKRQFFNRTVLHPTTIVLLPISSTKQFLIGGLIIVGRQHGPRDLPT
jgi:hypothetical protein